MQVSVEATEVLGVGAYGKVCRAMCGQLPCAAKLLHDTMFEHGDPAVDSYTRRFEQECQFLSTINHPNIIQYLGYVKDPSTNRPMLLMELMDSSLTRFLENSATTLPYHIQVDLCVDVALALAYLHLNGIVHRDLSSNNVLVMSAGIRAKVTDFGMSKLIDVNPRMTPLTQCPGGTVYMPPEALTTPPQYSDKLDCFSHGVLTIQLITREFPKPGHAHTRVEDPSHPNEQLLRQVPEAERRKNHIDLIEAGHTLLPLALECLKTRGSERPSAEQMCGTLQVLRREHRYTHSVRNQPVEIRRLQTELGEEYVMQQSHDRVQTLEQEVQQSQDRVHALEQEVQQSRGRVQTLEQEVQQSHDRIQSLEQEVRQSHGKIQALEQEVQQSRDRVQTFEEALLNKAQRSSVEQELKRQNNELQRDLKLKSAEIEKLKKDLECKARILNEYCIKVQNIVSEEHKKRLAEDQKILEQTKKQLLEQLHETESKLRKSVTGSQTEYVQLKDLKQRMTADVIPDCSTQKTMIRKELQQRLKKGKTWYLVGVHWMDQWKKYVGYYQSDERSAGQKSAHPGPLDNFSLLDSSDGKLMPHLWEKNNYFLLPESAWDLLLSWYGIGEGSHPIPRKVIEHGLQMFEVEVYLLELKLCTHSNSSEVMTKEFSKTCTVGELEMKLRQVFSVSEDVECRVWHKNIINNYELLSNSSQELQDIRLRSGQTILLVLKKKDGTWPHSAQ